MKNMKYKHENTIKNIGMLTFILIMIFMKVSNVPAQIFLGATLCICATLIGCYLVYKGLKLGGAFMFSIALMVLIGALGQYFDSYKLSVLIPAMLIIIIVFSYKLVVKTGDQEQIRNIKIKSIIGIILCLIIQVVMIIPLFIKI